MKLYVTYGLMDSRYIPRSRLFQLPSKLWYILISKGLLKLSKKIEERIYVHPRPVIYKGQYFEQFKLIEKLFKYTTILGFECDILIRPEIIYKGHRGFTDYIDIEPVVIIKFMYEYEMIKFLINVINILI